RVKRIGGWRPTATTLGLAPPGNEIPPLRGRQKPLQDPTPVERARTVTRMAGVLNHARNGMVQTQVTAQGCLGSTPEGRRPQIRGWRAGGSLAVSSPTPAAPLLSPAKIRELNHAAFAGLSYPTDRQVVRNPQCRAARFRRVNEHTPAHRRSAWATRGLASHTELPKSLRTIPTYIVYDNVAQCFGHELLSGAMRFSEEPNDRLHWLRTE